MASPYSLTSSNMQTSGMKKPTGMSDVFKTTIDSVAKYFKPQQAFTDAMNPNTYAAPYQAVANNFIDNNLRSEFNRLTYNPFQRQLSNTIAGSNAGMMGNTQRMLADQNYNVQLPFFNQAQQIRDQFAGLANQQYQDQFRKYYNSPTAFNNI